MSIVTDKNQIKTLILGLIPDNIVRAVSAADIRNSIGLAIDGFWEKLDAISLGTTTGFKYFDTPALGLAGTVDGDFFSSLTATSFAAYRNDLGVATLLFETPLTSFFQAPLPIANGGTSGSTVLAAQQALSVEPGVDVLALSATTAFSRTLLADASAAAGRASLEQSATIRSIAVDTAVAVSQRANVFIATANLILTLPAPATVGADFTIKVICQGGAASISPASGLVNGVAIRTIQNAESAEIFCDGTNYFMTIEGAYRSKLYSGANTLVDVTVSNAGTPLLDRHQTNGVDTTIVLAAGETMDIGVEHHLTYAANALAASGSQIEVYVDVLKDGVLWSGHMASVSSFQVLWNTSSTPVFETLVGAAKVVTLTGPGVFKFEHGIQSISFAASQICYRRAQSTKLYRVSDV